MGGLFVAQGIICSQQHGSENHDLTTLQPGAVVANDVGLWGLPVGGPAGFAEMEA